MLSLGYVCICMPNNFPHQSMKNKEAYKEKLSF